MSAPDEVLDCERDDDPTVPIYEYLHGLGFKKEDCKVMVGYYLLSRVAAPLSEIRECIQEIGFVIPEGPTFES